MRLRVELLLRTIASLALAGLLVLLARDTDAPETESIGPGHLAESLIRLSTSSAPSAATVRFDTLPGPVTRDWLRALAAAGTRVSWSAHNFAPSAASIEPMAEPEGRTRVRVAVRPASMIVLQDRIGTVDSTRAAAAVFATPLIRPAASVLVGGSRIVAAPPDSVLLRPVLVIGKANWETKFAVAALEERGWKTETRINVAPGTAIETVSGRAAVDTAHYSAVIVLQSPVSASLRAYTQQGGGLIVADTGAVIPENAIVLEKRKGLATIAAVRSGNGRTIFMKRGDTWKQRMSGEMEKHRALWSGLASSAAYAPRITRPSANDADLTPFASTVEALGPQTLTDLNSGTDRRRILTVALFAICLAGFFGEWLSRRTRGLV